MTENMALPTNEKKKAERTGCSIWVCPVFKVSGVFSSHMVLQRDKEIVIWGFSDKAGSKVSANFMGDTAISEVNADNEWILRFPARPYTKEPQVLEIYDDRGHSAVFEDILIGDVWMIGGQSNAELNLAPCLSLTPNVEFSEADPFRLFAQTREYVYTHQEFCNEPQRDIINSDWRWKLPGEEASREFSAVGWYFARELMQHIDVPLGLVMIAAGGACIRELVPEELAHLMGYDFGANVRQAGYYNTLIYPFLRLPFKAMIFFQGESESCDRTFSERYTSELAMLVEDERKSFGFDFPFYNIQLSDYRTEGQQCFPWHVIVRARQFDALKAIPNSTLTVDMDLGAPADYEDWAHSPRKFELAQRVAAVVLDKEYGIRTAEEIHSPMPETVRLTYDKKHIIIEFEHVGSGLAVTGYTAEESVGREVHGFFCGEYDKRMPAKAVITGKASIKVTVPENADTSYVGYAMSNLITAKNADLRNSVGLPCVAFMVRV
ncbi:MAG: hypothetical protein IJZ90_00735 [Clostridia bacterium]|nr:hypothetical protein [Clostridia bacterium]